MAPFSCVLKSDVPSSLHTAYDSIAKQGGNIYIIDEKKEIQSFAKELQKALNNGSIDKCSIIKMGYSCKPILPSEFNHDGRRTWASTYSSKAQNAAEDIAFNSLKYTNPILHKLASNNVTVEKTVKLLPALYAGMTGFVVGACKDVKEAFCGPSYKVE